MHETCRFFKGPNGDKGRCENPASDELVVKFSHKDVKVARCADHKRSGGFYCLEGLL